MSATDGAGPAASALVAELSFSFQDELTATIHNAFGVAVEIAVLEVTKLVGQALRDVRDQMHETLRENRALEQRLRATELELSVARGRARDADKGSVKGEEEKEEDEVRRAPATNPALVEPGVAARLDVRERYDVAGGDGHAEAGARNSRSSFCEIREDGQVCSQDLSPDLEGESRKERGSVTATFTAAVSKGNQTCMYSNSQVETQVVSFEQVCSDMPSGVDAAVLVKVQSSLDMDLQNPKAEQPVRVKEELSDLGCTSASAPFVEAGEDFGPDCLSLAQSKLLEDWRPEPLHLQSCDTDPLIPCTSHSLSDSPVFNPDLPDLDIHTPSSSSLHPPFSKPFPPEESLSHPLYSTQRSSTNASVPNVSVPNSTGTHTCRVCGETFCLPEELRQHRMQHHGAKPGRHPKRQAFPPGRSPYHCSLCGRDFNRMEHLKIHQRIHTGERPYACSVCSARFRHSWALTRHFRIHTGEKPYTCNLCGKTFRNCGGLRFHQRSHCLEGNS